MARLGPPAAAASGRICVHARLRLSGCGEGKRERRWRGMGWGEGLAQAVLALPPAPALPARSGKKARLAFGKRSCGIVENQGVAWSREAWA